MAAGEDEERRGWWLWLSFASREGSICIKMRKKRREDKKEKNGRTDNLP